MWFLPIFIIGLTVALSIPLGRYMAKVLDRDGPTNAIERVLKKDGSVCGTSNPVAFEKLHNMLMFHLANRQRSVDAVGQLQTAQIEAHVVEQLRSRFADLLGKWPPE